MKVSQSLLLILFLCFALCVKFIWIGQGEQDYRYVITGDGKGYYSYLTNSFSNNSLSNQEVDNRYIFEVDGRSVNKYYCGTAVCMLPFYVSAHAISSIQAEKINPYSEIFQKAISISALVYLLIGLIFLVKFLRLYAFSESTISLVIIAFSLGTNLFCYAVVHPAMSHIYSFAAICAFLYYSKCYFSDKANLTAVLCAISLGIVILIRPVDVVILGFLPFIAGSGAEFKKGLISLLKTKLLTGLLLVVLAICFIQMYLWYIQTGKWIVWSYGEEGFVWSKPKLMAVLFSFRKGLFIYSPLLLIALLGLIHWRKNRYLLLCYLGFLFVLVYVISSWWNWYYGPSFGQRPFVEFYALFSIPLALLVENIKTNKSKIFLILVIVACVALNLIQTYQYRFNIISSWDMTFEKYRYSFLKIGKEYQNTLGGNRDIYPLYTDRELIFSYSFIQDHLDGGATIAKLSAYPDFDREIIDYSGLEFNFSAELEISDNLSDNNGIFAVISLKRFELELNSCSESFFVFEYIDQSGKTTDYYSFKINEAPARESQQWREYLYTVDLPRPENLDDKIKIYIWNPQKLSFYIDDLEILIWAIVASKSD